MIVNAWMNVTDRQYIEKIIKTENLEPKNKFWD